MKQWKDNRLYVNGRQVGAIWKRDPHEDGYQTFPYGYQYNNSIGYLATSKLKAKKQVEKHT